MPLIWLVLKMWAASARLWVTDLKWVGGPFSQRQEMPARAEVRRIADPDIFALTPHRILRLREETLAPRIKN